MQSVIDKKKLGSKRNNYISWDEFFMGVVKLAAARSKDPSTQVGACIVDKNNRIIATGYNGTPRGISDADFPWGRDSENPLENKYFYVCHAEANALNNVPGDRSRLEGARIYVDLFPCNVCSQSIIQAGIKEVVYLSDKYADLPEYIASKALLNAAGVKYRQLEREHQNDFLLSLTPEKEVEKIKD